MVTSAEGGESMFSLGEHLLFCKKKSQVFVENDDLFFEITFVFRKEMLNPGT